MPALICQVSRSLWFTCLLLLANFQGQYVTAQTPQFVPVMFLLLDLLQTGQVKFGRFFMNRKISANQILNIYFVQ